MSRKSPNYKSHSVSDGQNRMLVTSQNIPILRYASSCRCSWSVYLASSLPYYISLNICMCISTLSLYLVHRYLRQVQDEVLRLSTLAPYAARFSEDDITVGGYPIPAMVRMSTVSCFDFCTCWKNSPSNSLVLYLPATCV